MKSQRPSQGHFAVSKTELYQKEQKQKKKKNRVKKAVLVGPDQCEIYSEVRRHVGVTSEKKKKKMQMHNQRRPGIILKWSYRQ